MIRYIGGKHRLAKQLIPLFPPHQAYVEPFAGMGHVLFAKEPSESELLNDRSEDIVNFLRVCQHHHGELSRHLRYAVSSRRLFELYQQQDPSGLTDVQRAARFFYLQRAAYGGRVVGRTYAVSLGSHKPFNQDRLVQRLERMASRLENVHLECRPYEVILERLDRESTFFFCDPPYVGTTCYAFNFSDEDYERLAERLAALRGRFMLTINDHPLARAVFNRFHRTELSVRYSVNPESSDHVRQLVFANYEIGAVAGGAADREAATNERAVVER